MIRRLSFACITTALLAAVAVPVDAQTRSKPRPATARSWRSIQIGGYATFGRVDFTARKSFDAILGTHTGPVFGGGARIGLPFGGLFVDIGASRFRAPGERAFIANNTIYSLGIPVEATVTPIDIGAGWQLRIPRVPKLIPYAGGGLTKMRYRETSDFSTGPEDVDEMFNGYHLIGGAEYKITRWLGIAGEAAWTTVPDALGDGGVSDAFNETDLGGKTFRLKITIGR